MDLNLKEDNNFEDLLSNLPIKIDNCYSELLNKVKRFNSFHLLSSLALYNNAHSTEKYEDYRGDRMFTIIELVALICLKYEYVDKRLTDIETYDTELAGIQDLTHKLLGLKSFNQLQVNAPSEDNSLKGIANKLHRDETLVRNPGHPDHHLEISGELYKGISEKLKANFGFDISETIILRKKIPELINAKYGEVLDRNEHEVQGIVDEIMFFKKFRKAKEGGLLSLEELQEYAKYSKSKLKRGLMNSITRDSHYSISEIYTFTANELHQFSGVQLGSVQSFLEAFSCTFCCVEPEADVLHSSNILKEKPIIAYNNRYLVPSLPLLTWCVEPAIEAFINNDNKLREKFKNLKHDYLLEKGIKIFASILKSAVIYPPNLFYDFDGEQVEADALITYDKTLFVIEAKGDRITPRAKQGKIDRVEQHLKTIVKKSYEQGLRTLNYILHNENAVFFPNGSRKIVLDTKDFNEYVIVSLTLEPLGNITPLIKATNALGYFTEGQSPWIISLYDLVIFEDFIENPALLLHYLKRRTLLLNDNRVQVFEELDILSIYMYNGLNNQRLMKDADEKEVSNIHLIGETDEINDYYMFKFGHKQKFTPKPKMFVSTGFKSLLDGIENSRFPNRSKAILNLLESDIRFINDLLIYIKNAKQSSKKEAKLKAFSTHTFSSGEIGVTYVVGGNKIYMDYLVNKTCNDRIKEMGYKFWIGIGDSSRDINSYAVECLCYLTL